MDELKFLTALNILYEDNKKLDSNDWTDGYAKAVYDVLQATKLCREPIKETKDL